MAFLKQPSNYKTSLLAQLKHIVSKTMYNDFKTILEPCCIPSVTYDTFTCGSNTNVIGVIFENVSISFPKLAGNTCKVFIVSSTEPEGGVINTITLDSLGNWTGSLQTSWYNSPSTINVQLLLLAFKSRVVYKSDVTSLTGVDNCD
jgi:hypothetical protein